VVERKLKAGVIGGGIGASIGPVHRMAFCLDGEAEVVAGAFSANPKKSRESALQLHVALDRSYDAYRLAPSRRSNRSSRNAAR
jgi:hypothetical protein